jgi:hypothetical protein
LIVASIEIAISVVSAIVILASILTYFLTTAKIGSVLGRKAAKTFVADYFGHGAIINAVRTQMNHEDRKYRKEQTEVVATIIWKYSGAPLSDILQIPEHRYNIYQGLSDPSKYPWDTDKSDHVKD